jgi:hypothetical protein
MIKHEFKKQLKTGDFVVVRQVTRVSIAIVFLASMLYSAVVAAHGRVEMEDDICMRQVGENMIHLSAYQPQNDIEGHYCTNIPLAGETLLVVDLVDPAMREMPVGLKVFKGRDEEDGEIITNLQPTYYRDGVISTKSALLDKGIYSVFVTAEGMPPLHYRYQLRVEMVNWGNVFRAAIGPVVGLSIILFILYKLFKSKRMRSWLASRRAN